MIKIKRGLALPISGAPEQAISDSKPVREVAVLGRDYIGMKPTMLVREGERVKLGQALFSDKKNPDVIYTAPAAGTVASINRGHQRVLQSVVIERDDSVGAVEFSRHTEAEIVDLDRQAVVDQLTQSGMWTSLRARPFSKVAVPDQQPQALFINTMDTNPLAADPSLYIKSEKQDFATGVSVLSKLPQQKTYVCHDAGDPAEITAINYAENVATVAFSGVHPAGLSGTHIHFTLPAGVDREVWYLNYQDVIAIGKLFATGTLCTDRVVSIAGPQVEKPRLVKTCLGANLNELLAGELLPQETRVVTGSVLGGRKATGVEAYLGRYHLQVTALKEGRDRPFMGYMSAGVNRHSVTRIYLNNLMSAFNKGRDIAMSTSMQGSSRAMVPIGAYEKIMPLDILPTQLLRALIVGDIEAAQNLGALELDEEDLALCSYVCPGKYEFGPILRENLTRIEKES